MNTPTKEQISEFWRWFISTLSNVVDPLHDQEFMSSLNAKVARLGNISWELGPGFVDPKNTSLVLSPSGDRETLKITSDFVAQAPYLDGWEFYAAKPPKQWNLFFTVDDKQGNTIEIDASKWRYALLRYSDNTYHIVIRMEDTDRLSASLRLTAAEIALDGELGETLRIQMIVGIDVVEQFDPQLSEKSNPFRSLRDHVYALTKSTIRS